MGCVDHGKTRNVLKAGYAKEWCDGKERLLHRIAYIKSSGKSWDDIHGLVIRHKCDNPRCINPEHLEIGTHADNTRDKMERGRHRSGKNTTRSIGIDNGRSKLNESKVKQIRDLDATLTHKEISEIFNISKSQVGKIIQRLSWKHIS